VEVTPERDLIDVAFIVCTALDRTGTVAVLTGGSAATYYAPAAYQSRDADFIIVMTGSLALASKALADIGYSEHGGVYEHEQSAFTLEFPPGPLAVGADIIASYESARRGDLVLNVLSRTDSVRDRLAGFYHWDDRSALNVAVYVALSGPIDMATIRHWSMREGMGTKFAEFAARYGRHSTGP
jgi:hypothetical protein